MKHHLNIRAGLVLLLALALLSSCRPRSSARDCNFESWRNPSIVVGADGVDVELFDDHARLTMDQLRDYLAELPERYWPAGKVVQVGEGGLRAGNTDDLIRRNLEQTKAIVRSLGIQIKCANVMQTAELYRKGDDWSASVSLAISKFESSEQARTLALQSGASPTTVCYFG